MKDVVSRGLSRSTVCFKESLKVWTFRIKCTVVQWQRNDNIYKRIWYLVFEHLSWRIVQYRLYTLSKKPYCSTAVLRDTKYIDLRQKKHWPLYTFQNVFREGMGSRVPQTRRDQHPLLGRGAPTRPPSGLIYFEIISAIYLYFCFSGWTKYLPRWAVRQI